VKRESRLRAFGRARARRPFCAQQGKSAAKGGLFRGRMLCSKLGQRYWVGASMTKPADRTRLADNDRREIAKRIFDALCAHYPQNTSRWSNRAIQLQLPAFLMVSHSTMVFEQYKAPPVAAEPATAGRLAADLRRISAEVASRVFRAHRRPTATIRYYRCAERSGCS
jgi:hypothetical protein